MKIVRFIGFTANLRTLDEVLRFCLFRVIFCRYRSGQLLPLGTLNRVYSIVLHKWQTYLLANLVVMEFNINHATKTAIKPGLHINFKSQSDRI